MNEQTFLQALHENPGDEVTWLALADWLDDDGQHDRAELIRLTRRLHATPVARRTRPRVELEKAFLALFAAGARPVVPELVNSVGMRLALIPAGVFRMGSPGNEKDRFSDEGPTHEVEITRPFYLGVFTVTQRQYERVMGNNPSHFRAGGEGAAGVAGLSTSDFPVECVSRRDAQAFCQKLSERAAERKARRRYRLPTEAEWEYACRGGACTTTPFFFGNDLASTQANFNGDFPYGKAPPGPNLGRTCAAGSYRPNVFGLYDMHGNVWEWCADWFERDYYERSPRKDPQGPEEGGDSAGVLRGGCWVYRADNLRSAIRYRHDFDEPGRYFGFRALCTVER